jgi:hypothetical protein
MINNADYLIQKYAEAREKSMEYGNHDPGHSYWKGVMDTYHSLLILGFNDWAEHGTTGYFVFTEGMSYDEALNAVNQFNA